MPGLIGEIALLRLSLHQPPISACQANIIFVHLQNNSAVIKKESCRVNDFVL